MSSSVRSFITSALLVIGTSAGGTLLGGLYAKFLMPRRGMGWDQLADALGAMMIGTLVGFVLGLIICQKLRKKVVAPSQKSK